MTTFALVHGAWQGGWCWERLIQELEHHGHTAIARDELGRSYWPDEDDAIDALYGDCPRQLGTLAAARLRPQGRGPSIEPCPLAHGPAVESVSSPFLSHPAELAGALVSVGL